MRSILSFAICLLAALPLRAANIYISANDGSDATGSGSIGSPYATVQKGADEAQPGDTVYVRGGLYNEGVVLKTDGEKDNRIVFSAYPGETPILDGSEPVSGWNKCANATDCADNPNWANIWYIPIPGDVDAAGVGIYEAGEALKQAMFPNQPHPFYNDQAEFFHLTPKYAYTETTVADSDIFVQADPAYWLGAKIWLWGGNNNITEEYITGYDPAQNMVTFTKMDFDVNKKVDRYAIVNHIFALDTLGEYVVDTATARIYLWPRYTADPNDGSVYRGMHGNGFKINDKDFVTIQGFSIRNYEDFSLGYTRDGAGIINYSTDTSYYLELYDNLISSIQGDAIGLGGCINCTIERNTISSVHGKGIFNNKADSTIVRNNEVFQSSSTAIGFYRSKECLILENYVHDCNGHHGNGLTFYLGCHNMLAFGNRVIRGNICVTIQQSEAIYVINNVLFNPDSHKQGISVWGRADNPLYPSDPTIDSLVFLNNIVYGSIGVSDNIGAAYNFNNIVGGYCVDGNGVRAHGYNVVWEPQWCQPETGVGIIEQTDVDLIFTDYANDDFSIIATSPAVDAATDVSEFWPTGIFPDFDFSQDIRGVARPQQGGWDIGPYEYTTVGMSNVELRMINTLRIPNPASWSIIGSLSEVRVLELDGSEAVPGGNGVFLLQSNDHISRILIKE